ncbi:MAG: hypothetical protein JW860_06970 [Sedimentisphaerales bacterium]|nr:hypothetical protein [Sedimentisphaerales bacterium]
MPENNKHGYRRWMTDGATMVYSRKARLIYWVINLLLYTLLNMYALWVQSGHWIQFKSPYTSVSLIPRLLYPLNIFQFPSYILVIGLLMALICTVPILIALLYNFSFSLPFILLVFFPGHNRILALCLLVSCAAVSFEPMRFKSKFVAAVLCLVPELIYWGIFSWGNPEQNILRWAVLYAPWILAFFISVILLGIVIAAGHFLRYRPGILMPIFGLSLAGAVMLFNTRIGMNERDFQAQVYRYSPEQVMMFQNRSIKGLLEIELAERKKQADYLSDELIRDILRIQWRIAFNPNIEVLPEYEAGGVIGGASPISRARREANKFERTKFECADQIDSFIRTHPDDPRVADALYYKGLLIDLKVDSWAIRDEDMLRFCYDFPSAYSELIWNEILAGYPDRDVALEARYRLAHLMARRTPKRATESFSFDKALLLLEEARALCLEELKRREQESTQHPFWESQFGTIFSPPPQTIRDEQMWDLLTRIERLMSLIGKENRTGHLRHEERLAAFVGLDPYQLIYKDRLKDLMFESPQPDPLQDNIELTLAMLLDNPEEKETQLVALIEQFPGRDATVEAMLELARLRLEKAKNMESNEERETLMSDSKKLLNTVISLKPDFYSGRQAKQLLETLSHE